ncbi:alpha/beta fold hydrolase [Bacillus thuringiensis]|uniref:alpha/beta fold hydrolase n=1 Tax=Bacillus thuringiensis TaxID=1428 RepID=UPI003335174F
MDFRESGLSIEYSSNKILGILTTPSDFENNSNIPCVIFCHGYNGNRVEDNRITVKLAREFSRLGIMSFRFDFLGSGVSDGYFHEWTLNDRVDQVHEIINQLYKKLKFTNLGLIGISDGCRVVLDVGLKNDNVNALAIVSPQFFNNDWKLDNQDTPKMDMVLKRSKLHRRILPSDDVGVWLHPRYFGNEGQYYIDLIKKTLSVLPILSVFGEGDPYVRTSKREIWKLINSNLSVHNIQYADHLYSSEKWIDELFQKILQFFSQSLKGDE